MGAFKIKVAMGVCWFTKKRSSYGAIIKTDSYIKERNFLGRKFKCELNGRMESITKRYKRM